ncbi:protein of unknown function [Paraburkholderia kururiensis]
MQYVWHMGAAPDDTWQSRIISRSFDNEA